MSDIFVLKREAAGEPFAFELDGEKFSATHAADLDQFALVDLFDAGLGDKTFIARLFELALGDDLPRLRKLRLKEPELYALFAAYQRHCGIDAGESTAS